MNDIGPKSTSEHPLIKEHALSVETATAAAQRLAALSVLEYEQVRELEAEKLKVRVRMLDAEVKKLREKQTSEPRGRSLHLSVPEPWDKPVLLGAILNEVANALDRHLILDAAARDVIALWVAHTWVYQRFQHTPRLAITSPEKRCGKSTLLDILRALCHRPLKADNISTAGLFRTVEALKPLTLLIDEADTYLGNNEELRGILNSGYEASGTVIRIVDIGKEHHPAQFTTFTPVALAAIGTIPGTLEDRSLPVRLQRKTAAQRVTKLREPGAREALNDVARKLARWGQNVCDLSTNPLLPASLNDREGDISLPLVSIADAAGEEWVERGRTALVTLFGIRAADDDMAGTGTMLLADIRAIFDQSSGALRIASVDLAEQLGGMEERPWAEWRCSKPMTAPQLACALRPFRVKPITMRIEGGKPKKGYQRDHFTDAWERYLTINQQSEQEAVTR